MTIALLGWLLNAWKAFRERRAEVRADRDKASKSGAERDSIAVHSAEAALLLMEKMLNQANASVDKLQQRLEAVECQKVKCQEELAALKGNKKEDS